MRAPMMWRSVSIIKRSLAPFAGVAVAIMALATAGAAQAPATVPPPINDDYLNSLNVNNPGTKLNDTDTLENIQNTTNATVQSNIFDPCGLSSCPQGGAEDTRCRGFSYGNTIWYGYYPNVNGTVQIQTSGFDNVIALYSYNKTTLEPDVAHHICVHTSDFPSEQLVAPVKKGLYYTYQIGGVNNAAGEIEMLFDFYAQAPQRLTAEATLKALALSNGIELLGLTVSTARAANVAVSCGRFCHSESAFGDSVERFPHLSGVQMPAGSDLQIRVTAPGSIGYFIQYAVLPGNFVKTTGCLEPGKQKPQQSCK